MTCPYLPAHYPGTGDTFTSVITGSLMQGDSLPMALDLSLIHIFVAVLQLAQFLGLVLADGLLPCFRLFLVSQFYRMVHDYLALQWLAHFNVCLLYTSSMRPYRLHNKYLYGKRLG